MKKLLVLVLFLFFSISLCVAGVPFPDPDESVPIDGGISLLMALGLLLGVKKLTQKRK